MAIDMGIKNFSYAKLQLDKTLPFNTPPLIKEWTKFNVQEWAKIDSGLSYDPLSFARLSYRVVDELIYNKNEDVPDVVLIERQRIRSASAKNVLEWVYRVNMFESMIHATIFSKKQADSRITDSTIVAAEPKRMGNYWVQNQSTEKITQKKNSKSLRIGLVEKWLSEYSNVSTQKPFILPIDVAISNDESKRSRSASKWIFETIMKNSRFNKDGGDSKAVQKADDLVDSLLHGLAYINWEKNRMILNMEMKGSLEAAIETSNKIYDNHMESLQCLESRTSKKVK